MLPKTLKIGIVEDEVLIAENITMHLEDMGHTVIGVAGRFEEAIQLVKEHVPDLLFVDIRLRGKESGLDVAREVHQNYGIPFLFLTSNTDKSTIQQAMQWLPLTYITKPFSFEDLFIALELAKTKIELGGVGSNNRKIEIKNGGQTEWVMLHQVLYLEAARSYVTIFLRDRSIVLRQPMGALMEIFNEHEMVRVHRSFAVNPEQVESVSNTKAIINGKKIPIGPKHREPFFEWMRQRQS